MGGPKASRVRHEPDPMSEQWLQAKRRLHEAAFALVAQNGRRVSFG